MTSDGHTEQASAPATEDFAASAIAELERAAELDHETRLAVLEDVYRSLEAQLDSAGSDALQ